MPWIICASHIFAAHKESRERQKARENPARLQKLAQKRKYNNHEK